MKIKIFAPLHWGQNRKNGVDPEVSNVGHNQDPGQVDAAEGRRRQHAGEATRVDVVAQEQLQKLK